MSGSPLPLSAIRLDGGTQSRAEIHAQTVAEYADAIDALPPVVVFYDGADYWLADGFHRAEAHRRAQRETITADVRDGSRRDAVLFSVGANGTHGLRRRNADKRRAVETLLRDEEWGAKSDRWIAERCGVGHQLVASARAELDESSSSRPAPRTGRDGKVRRAPRKRRHATPVAPTASTIADRIVDEHVFEDGSGSIARVAEIVEEAEEAAEDFVDFVEAARVDRFVHDILARWPENVGYGALIRALKTALHGVEQREKARSCPSNTALLRT